MRGVVLRAECDNYEYERGGCEEYLYLRYGEDWQRVCHDDNVSIMPARDVNHSLS